jgi:NADH-quinone oxidoreductase subunit A
MVPTQGLENFLPLLFVFLLGLAFAGTFLFLSLTFGPKRPRAEKLAPYECGAPPTGDARHRFSVKFFIVAMIFLLFDVEVVFLFPWVVLLKNFKAMGVGLSVLLPMVLFLLMLLLGLIYEWRRGALDWEK